MRRVPRGIPRDLDMPFSILGDVPDTKTLDLWRFGLSPEKDWNSSKVSLMIFMDWGFALDKMNKSSATPGRRYIRFCICHGTERKVS